jgi:hypothetical protein
MIASGSAGLVNSRALNRQPLVFVGLISYPLYLWHWPLLAFPFIVVGADPGILIQATAVLAAVILAALTYLLIERPIRERRAGALWQFGLLSAFPAVVAGVFFFGAGVPSRSNIAPYVATSIDANRDKEWNYAQNDICNEQFPYEQRREDWHFCILEKDAAPTLMLVGNSFANHLFPGLANMPELKNHNILQFGICFPVIGVSFTAYRQGHPCHGANAVTEADYVSGIIEKNPTIRYAIINSPWPAFDNAGRSVKYTDMAVEGGVFRSNNPVHGETSYDAFMAGLDRRIAFVVEHGVQPVLFMATPQLPYPPETCLVSRPLKSADNDCRAIVRDEAAIHARFREGVASLVSKYPTLRTFDASAAVCGSEYCDLVQRNRLLLRDVGHLSVYGSGIVADAFVNWAKAEMPEILNRQ